MKLFNQIEFCKKLCAYSPRQGVNALESSRYIQSVLQEYSIEYIIKTHKIKTPIKWDAVLTADGVKIPCLGSCMVSGEVENKYSLISSLISSQQNINLPNINFNPECDEISLSNFYFAPAVAISKHNVQKIIDATKVQAKVDVKIYEGDCDTILVGNILNPKNIIFSHYDCIETGATDNASGISTMLASIVDDRSILETSLFIFDGNEEVSYDYPIYWGSGYRNFEKYNFEILRNAEKIIVVDSVGNGINEITQEKKLLSLAFPLASSNELADKIYGIFGEYHTLMKVYQAKNDTVEVLSNESLGDAREKLLYLLSK